MVQHVLADDEWATALTDTDRRGLTPPFWTHVAPDKEAVRTSVSSSRPKTTSETTLISVTVSINAGTTQEYDDLRNIRSSGSGRRVFEAGYPL